MCLLACLASTASTHEGTHEPCCVAEVLPIGSSNNFDEQQLCVLGLPQGGRENSLEAELVMKMMTSARLLATMDDVVDVFVPEISEPTCCAPRCPLH
jgi:hypothetical protein